MMNFKPLALFTPIVAFMACAQTPATAPSASSQVLGRIELSLDPTGNQSKARVSTRSALPDNAITVGAAESPLVFDDLTSNTRYISVRFPITNNTTSNFNNLTLYAYNQAGASVGGTAIKQLVNFAGGSVNDALNAQRLLPVHGIDGSSTTPDPSRADFQSFSASEVSSLKADAVTQGAMTSADSVLDYGFVARNGSGRTILANGGTGTITAAYKVPSNSVTGSYRFVANFVLANETVTRVTRGLGETTSAVNARAAALSASEVVLIGSDTDTASTGATIRIPNTRISTTPAMLLEPECSTGTITTTIPAIQGTGSTTTATGSVTIEGVVTGDFQNVGTTTNLSGFYLQDRFGDGNASTSDGIFVFGSSFPDVSAGDFIRLTGTPTEFSSTAAGNTSKLTQITNPTLVENCGSRPQPAAVSVSFPVNSVSDLEPYEGMKVTIPSTMTVSEHFQLGQYGQLVLSSDGTNNVSGTDGRFDQYTQFNAPSVSGYAAYLAENAKRRIYLDDGRSIQNPDPIIFGRGGNPLSATNTLRGGDTVANLSGILDERFEGYRIQATSPVNFVAANPRPTGSPDVGATATLRVVGANVLNYFNTLGAATFTPPGCAAIAGRGADDATELARQQDRLKQALLGLNADVIGVLEMQNNGNGAGSAIQTVVDFLNAATSPGTYASISAPANGYGCDAIKADVIYKPGKVIVVGNPVTPPDGFSPAFDSTGLVGRKPVAVTFQQVSNGARFTFVTNHFKSKGSSAGGTGDADANDGQGLSNGTRVLAAQALSTWLATNPTGNADADKLLVGDFNAYAKEDPLTTLETNGFANLIPATTYSYVFNAQWGALDHAFGSSSLVTQVTGATKWHINADEPSVLDYNTNFKSAGQISSLFDNTLPYRASDHDPVVIGLNLDTPASSDFSLSAAAATPASVPAGTGGALGSTVSISRTNFTDPVTLSLSNPPSGISASFNPNATTANSSSATINVDSSVAAGVYNLSISGTNGILTRTAPLSVTVCGVNSLAVAGGGSVSVGGTLSLTATVNRTPGGCGNGAVTWSSSNTAIASVNSSGVVSGVAVGGPVTITATSVQDPSKSGTANVSVNSVAAGKIVISQVYGGGGNTGAPYRSDFIELFNAGGQGVNIGGWSVQYAAATSTTATWQVTTLPSINLAPGQYYLVKQADGANLTLPALPTPDATGTIAMGSTAGKVALMNNTTPLAVSNPSGNANLIDLVGYGSTANGFEGAPTPAPSNTTSVIRAASGCTDANNNSSDFAAGAPNPRNTATTLNVCP